MKESENHHFAAFSAVIVTGAANLGNDFPVK
jgi:hypothetical protein